VSLAGPPDASALEHLPHLVRKICELWGKDEFEHDVNQVIMDSRDGKRQGLPPDAVEELLFLLELTVAKRALFASESTGMPFREAFRLHLAKSQKFSVYQADETADPWMNARDRGAVSPPPGPPSTPVKRAPTRRKKSWWRRLLGSR